MVTSDPNSAGCKRHDGQTSIAVARDQVIYRVAGHPWDEWEAHVHRQRGSLARNAQHGFGI